MFFLNFVLYLKERHPTHKPIPDLPSCLGVACSPQLYENKNKA